MHGTRFVLLLATLSLSLVGCLGDDPLPSPPTDSAVEATSDSAPTCSYKGKVYADGEEFMDECNACKCNPTGSTPGVHGCTLKACNDGGGDADGAATCSYKGKVYADGEEFMDECNACKCNPTGGTPGVHGCTVKACNDASSGG